MLLSISLILIVGMSMAWLCQRLRLPGLMGKHLKKQEFIWRLQK